MLSSHSNNTKMDRHFASLVKHLHCGQVSRSYLLSRFRVRLQPQVLLYLLRRPQVDGELLGLPPLLSPSSSPLGLDRLGEVLERLGQRERQPPGVLPRVADEAVALERVPELGGGRADRLLALPDDDHGEDARVDEVLDAVGDGVDGEGAGVEGGVQVLLGGLDLDAAVRDVEVQEREGVAGLYVSENARKTSYYS